MKAMRVGLCVFAGLGLFAGLSGFQKSIDDQALRNLDPVHPAGYYELGESVLIAEDSQQNTSLALQLFARAAYWGEFTGEDQVAASACIAIASQMTDASKKRWFWDLALLLNPTREREWARATIHAVEAKEKVAQSAAACLYSIRYHEHPEAVELYRQAGVKSKILDAGERAGIPRLELMRILEQELERGAADPCHGRLYIADRGSPGMRIVCPDHLRGLGMCANDEELRSFLRVEMILNDVEVGSWASAESMAMDEAVILPRVEDLRSMFGVDVEKAFYRDGRWVTSP